MTPDKKQIIIIGAGPAGLTAAYELLEKTELKPIIFEQSNEIGGISKTVNYKNNRIDIGGHRFFSKSTLITKWWQNILPIQGNPSPNPEKTNKVMLVRNRLSRIFFLKKLFDYPISLNLKTINNLGIIRLMKISLSYIYIKFSPIKQEKNLEDFFINRFGKELYQTFFKDYTEKVWGVPCDQIKPEWGAQRIKGLSITKTIKHAIKNTFKKDNSLMQKGIETSLIGQFMYPKFGPGQMWEEVANQIKTKGGKIHQEHTVIGLREENKQITEVEIIENKTKKITIIKPDYVISSMPVKDLVKAFKSSVSDNIKNIATNLAYRDFITVGLLLKKLKLQNNVKIKTKNNIIPDNWIYIQEPEVKICRLQIFNNWSPYLVKDPETIWVGLEYICSQEDNLWKKTDSEFIDFAINELETIGIIEANDIIDQVIIRVPKAYPAYFGSYDQFSEIKDFADQIENLFLVGRNGMHRYNNMDHSMLTAMKAVDNIINNIKTKDNIWNINTEQEYHEKK